MATEEDLRGFTIERLRELCAEKHISISARKKEELIAALMDAGPESKTPEASSAAAPSSAELFELILTMQRQQMTWMESQQRRQEEWMHLQQESQREMMGRMREQQERGRVAAEEARRVAKLPKPMLQKFTEKDDVESYLDMFERVAAQQEWPKETWATQLAGLLSGNALDCYSSLAPASAKDYDLVKAAILKRYDVSAETYRQRFRAETRKPTESYGNFGERLADHLERWEKAAEGMDLRQLVLLEQFLQALPRDMAVRVREERPKSMKEATEMADNYELARKAEGGGAGQSLNPPKPTVPAPSKSGPPSQANSRLGVGAQRSRTNSKGDIQCWECKKYGHMAIACPDRKSSTKRASSKSVMVATQGRGKQLMLREGKLDGKAVQVLLDTGSETSIARTNLVDPTKCTQEMVGVKCVHGNVVAYPTATVDLEMDGWEKEITVALVPEVPVDVVMAWDDHDCPRAESKSLVTTRAQKRQQLQEKQGDEAEATPSDSLQVSEDLEVEVDDPLLARGPVSGYPDLLEGGNGPVRSSGLHPSNTPSRDPHARTLAVLQATPEQLRDWQQTDPTLGKVRELASSKAGEKPGGATFFYHGGLIYRKWSPKNRDALSWDQLVLPQQCRQLVLNIAHDLPTAGHLGTNKTRGRILKCYYWPGVFRQVADYCKTCEVCQKSQRRRHLRQAEMISMPLIDVPFQRIAMDVVGPLPRSRSGNKYILTICDYSTRYPEAIALPSIEASRIAKELVSLFSRVGIPEEILTDQGSNFMSALLQEVYQLLGVSRIRTTPYHPQTDGLVERFNGTLKAMMKKFTSKTKKDWDEYLPYLLFAYREAPQESTGFSPFELLYGRRVRGPLDVLREVWTEEESEKTTEITHLVQMRERLEEMSTLVRTNLTRAQ